MREKYCSQCGTALIEKELKNEGIIPFCPSCGEYRFPVFNTAVSMIVINQKEKKILLIKQYGKDAYILVAGYVNRTENLEDAVRREIREETGMEVTELHFNRSSFFEPSNTLMCNFTAYVNYSTNEIIFYEWTQDNKPGDVILILRMFAPDVFADGVSAKGYTELTRNDSYVYTFITPGLNSEMLLTNEEVTDYFTLIQTQ